MGEVVSLEQRRIAYDAARRQLDCRNTLFAIHERAHWFSLEKPGAITLTLLGAEIVNYERAVERLLEVASPSGVDECLRQLIVSAWALYFSAGALVGKDAMHTRAAFADVFAVFSSQAFGLFPRLGKNPPVAR